MKFTDIHLGPMAVAMGISGGINFGAGDLWLGGFMVLSAMVVGICGARSVWLAGHMAATKEHIGDMQRILKKLDEAGVDQKLGENWWKKERP